EDRDPGGAVAAVHLVRQGSRKIGEDLDEGVVDVGAGLARLGDDRDLRLQRKVWSGRRDGAAAFEEGDVAPAAVVAADALPRADDTEPGALVEPQAGGVLWKDPGLDGPDSGRVGGAGERLQQREPDALALRVRVHVDGVFDDAPIHRPR